MSIFSDIGNLIGNDIKNIETNLTNEESARIAADNVLTDKITNTVDAWFNEDINGEVEVKKNLIPADATVSLGSIDKPFADVFISQSSLYVNGTKVLSENAGTIDISADPDQNIRISTKGAGDIEFYPSDLGVIQLKGSVQVQGGKLLLTSDGQPLQIGQGISVDGDVLSDNITALQTTINNLSSTSLNKNNNLSDVNVTVARNNLGVYSTGEVDTAITNAQIAMGTNFDVADIAARDALTGLDVADRVFVQDDGDGKWALYKSSAVDANGKGILWVKLMDQDSLELNVSASSIKTSYESNANTNAYTDAAKATVDNIGTIAEFDSALAAAMA